MRIAFILDNIILGQEPLGVTTLGAVLKQHQYEVKYFEIARDRKDWSTIPIIEFNPDILAYSVSTGLQKRYLDFNLILRRKLPNSFSLFGGPHPTYFPDFLQNDGVDAICVGEGEEPLLELVKALESKTEYYHIKNLHFKMKDGTTQCNPPRRYQPDLDCIPSPDHTFMNEFPHLRDSPIAYVMAGRGCPYHCTFCFNHVALKLQGGRYTRYRSPESVVNECIELRDGYGKRFVAFQDDTFSLNLRYLQKLLPLYREKVGLPYLCHVRADNLTATMAKLLADTGCSRVVMGLENGMDEIRLKILDKRVSTEHLLKAAGLLHQNRIQLITQNMFGVPGETIESVLETIDLNIQCGVSIMIVHFFQPYPGTELGRLAVEMGLWSGTVDDIPEDNHWFVVLNYPEKDLMTQLGHLSWFFVDYPKVFKSLKPILANAKTRKLGIFLLRLCQYMDRKTLFSKKRGSGSRWSPPKAILALPQATTAGMQIIMNRNLIVNG